MIAADGGSAHYVPSSASELSEVLARLIQSAKVVSADCTRLAVVFHEAPPPSSRECGVVCQKVEQSALQLAAAFYQLHIKHGKTLSQPPPLFVSLVKSFVYAYMCFMYRIAGKFGGL
jgi:hypothetical protein